MLKLASPCSSLTSTVPLTYTRVDALGSMFLNIVFPDVTSTLFKFVGASNTLNILGDTDELTWASDHVTVNTTL